jgi:hypothetical protein
MDDDSYQEESSSDSGSGSGDTYTETTSESWFGRIGNAIKGIVVGVILLGVGFYLLFWNEGRAVTTYKALQEGAGIVASIPADKVDPANEGKLVHLTGLATSGETLTDPDFGVSARAIKLQRQAQMYQWKENKTSETEKHVGGSTTTKTTYSYEKVWSPHLIKSGDFKKPGHSNPAQLSYEPRQFSAGKVTVGAFQLSSGLIDQISGSENLPPGNHQTLPENLWGKARWEGNTLYIGRDSRTPEIGDTKVEFKVVTPQTVSIIAKMDQNHLEPYQTSAGRSLEMLQAGVKSPEAMFQQAHTENKVLTWILRFLGGLLLFLGISLILKLLSVVLDVIPFLGNVAEAGIGLVALLVALALTLITVAIAWLFYRPLLAVVLILAGLGLILGIGKLRGKAPVPQPSP